MALYTDGLAATLEDLRQYDSTVLDVAGSEGVDLGAKLMVAQRELGLEIASFLLRNQFDLGPHRDLRRILVTEPVLHALCIHSLELVYRDAYNSQLNDRHQGKWKEFSRLSEQARKLLWSIGVGVNHGAVPRAGAPICASSGASTLPDRTYSVQAAWEASSGGSGGKSELVTIDVAAGQNLSVRMTERPQNAVGWHVFIGLEDDPLVRQNENLLHPTDLFESGSGLRADLPQVKEQTPLNFIVEQHQTRRG